jgi:hypothetical protein
MLAANHVLGERRKAVVAMRGKYNGKVFAMPGNVFSMNFWL